MMYAAQYDKIKKELQKELDECVENRIFTDDGERWVDTMDRYRNLHATLEKAFERAAFGKGAERHARGGEKFEDQYIIRGATSFGIGGLYFQMGKKLEESINLSGDKRINELRDIIIYAAAAIMITEGAGIK